MDKSQKNIPVNLVAYEPYENFPIPIASLGKISIKEVEFLMDKFKQNFSTQKSCIVSMTLEYIDRTHFGRKIGGGIRFQALDISGMFYPDRTPMCGKPSKRMTDEQKIRRCARNLQNGTCCDEFIRTTLGAILYPQQYTKQK